MKLNPAQQEAVEHEVGPLLVLAGAGSGKTRVIVGRIARLIERGVRPEQILGVTFTNKAAGEMAERLGPLVGEAVARRVVLSTFHSFGVRFLGEEWKALGTDGRFVIFDQGDSLGLVREILSEHVKAGAARKLDIGALLARISKWKNDFVSPDELRDASTAAARRAAKEGVEYDDVAREIYPRYEAALRAMHAVDFDDLVVAPVRILRDRPDLREKWQTRFRHMLVDEFQDTSRSQLELVRLLANPLRNVCVVGDDDQCIYSWRGAEVRNILDFERLFPGGKAVRLEQNYRSTQLILDAANAVIEKNPDRRPKRMWSEVKAGPKITVVAAPSEEEEARWVAGEVKRAIAEGVSPDEIAILYRVNGQSRFLEEYLRERQVRYEVIGGSEFFDRREVKDVIAYFKVIANPKDEVSLLRIVNVPSRGIGDVTMERLTAWALANEVPLWTALGRAAEVDTLPQGAAEKVAEFVALIERYRRAFNKGNLAAVTRELLGEIDFVGTARASAPSLAAGDRKAKAVAQVIDSLEAYEKREGPKASLLTYLNRLALDTRDEEDEPQHLAGRVTMMTLHGAKGLEWKLVFMVGLEEDLLPHSGMQGEPPNPQEERRLCYVGMTRARERLVMTRATQRIKRGREVPRTPSRFLADIPESLCEVIDIGAVPEGPPSEREQSFFASLRDRLKGAPAPPTSGGNGA